MDESRLHQLDDYIAYEFRSKFTELIDEPIAIYGIGERTGRLLERIGNDYSIIGLLDGKTESGEIWGKRIVSLQEVVDAGCKIIIVVARAAVISTIYHRIENFVKKNNLDVYDIHGENLADRFRDRGNDIPYYNVSFEELRKACDSHDIVTFDIFDTLLIRRTLYPSDIFYYIENNMNYKLDESLRIEDFASIRMEAEDRCYKKGINPKIEDIYGELSLMVSSQKDVVVAYMQEELAVELAFSAPREKMIGLFNELKNKKPVYLISDMYLRKEFIEQLLEKAGCTGYKDVYVSCEYGCSKRDGLYAVFKRKEGFDNKTLSILHIGDHEFADGVSAEEAGIDSFCIMSERDILENSSYKNVKNAANSLIDNLMIGLFCQRAFDDPFIMYGKKGKLEIGGHKLLSYLFFAPLISAFTIWLIEGVLDVGCDRVLYTSRDAYVLKKLVELVVNKQGWTHFPTGEYTYVSRRALNIATIETRADIDRIVGHEFYGGMGELLKSRFGIETNNVDEALNSQIDMHLRNGMLDAERRWNEISQIIDVYEGEIIQESNREKQNYINYLDKIKGNGNTIACIDFVAAGTVQSGLAKLMPEKRIVGYYFQKKNTDETSLNEMEALSFYEPKGEFQMEANIYRYYLLLEMILSSPEPTLYSISDDGKPVFMEESRTEKQIRIMLDMQDEILNYMNAIVDLYPDLKNVKINCQLPDLILGMIDKEYTMIDDDDLTNMVLRDEYLERSFNIFDKL